MVEASRASDGDFQIEDFEEEIKSLRQRNVVLTGLIGILVALLERDPVHRGLLKEITSEMSRAMALIPTVPNSEWEDFTRVFVEFHHVAGKLRNN